MKFEVGKSSGRVLTLLLWGALLLPWGAAAQTTTGTLRGTVKDETGGALPGAGVDCLFQCIPQLRLGGHVQLAGHLYHGAVATRPGRQQ